MRLQNFITANLVFGLWSLVFGLCLFTLPVLAQKIAIITPEKTANIEKISFQLNQKFNSLDSDLVEITVKSQSIENLFNLSTEEAKTLGNAIGCDFFILLKSESLRRTSFAKPVYFEAYLSAHLVSTRSGRLLFWDLKSVEAENVNEAETQLFGSTESLIKKIQTQIKAANQNEITDLIPNLEELPDENSPEAKNFQSPLPFRRLRPEYTRTADLYGVTATVDATVDLDEKGQITRLEITRWAGYGLDESVIETIRRMQWRPASRNGKTLPIRVLLRYNFKKVEKE